MSVVHLASWTNGTYPWAIRVRDVAARPEATTIMLKLIGWASHQVGRLERFAERADAVLDRVYWRFAEGREDA